MLINYPDNKTQKCRDYIQALEEERRKIQVFRRELPLCLDLVTQAIESYKQQLSGTTTEYNLNGQSECSEQTTSAAPVLEQFIPMKSAQEDDDEDYEEQSRKSDNDDDDHDDCVNKNNDNNNSEKSDWLRSVQLWNQFPDPTPKEESPEEVKRNGSGGAFQPFKKEKSGAAAAAQPPTAASSTAETGRSKKEDKESQRKQRRCWSPELHKRFLQALQQLGGSHAATPKQIREMMKVDGLTNDEVKSHLQKYRLHTRRPSPSNRNNSIQQQAAPQFVVVGGIWVPPAEYAAMAAAPAPAESKEATTSNGIYAPVASLPPSSAFQGPSALNRRACGFHERGSQSNDGRVHSNSPATSSSTHTTTASPPY
ncbi:PREDICTED: myb family transcription factor EFM-like [Ipomoea nil]|uniref:myb family transcription factor EFM-like n=1 Tax=Ipomoea nil TaxID=35883 RepID=UPI0009011A1E|nr:PREDICTED: myb family transcription factor EFM-like [Ipomoea nil]